MSIEFLTTLKILLCGDGVFTRPPQCQIGG
jgi:hypothetical protein